MAGTTPRLFAVLLVVAVAFAGCTKKDPGTGDGPPEPPATNTVGPTATNGPRVTDTAGAKPLWFEGLQWVYAVEYPDRGVTGDMTITVVRDDGGVWQLGAEANDDIMLWSLFIHLPALGPVDKATLAPSIHDQPIRMFDFPLTDGKTWSAPEHHGTLVNYTAKKTETTLFDGRRVPAYEVVGERQGADWIRYTYTAEVAGVAAMEIHFAGNVVGRMTMTDARATTDHLTTMSYEPKLIAHFEDVGIETLSESPESFTVSGEATDVYAYFVMGGAQGHYSGAVTFNGEQLAHSYNYTEVNQTPAVKVFAERFDPIAGSGTFGSVVLGQGFVLGELFAVVRRAPPE